MDVDLINQSIENVKVNGFINYFGLQRVGVPTEPIRAHHIGQAMLSLNFSLAISLILAYSDNDPKVSSFEV